MILQQNKTETPVLFLGGCRRAAVAARLRTALETARVTSKRAGGGAFLTFLHQEPPDEQTDRGGVYHDDGHNVPFFVVLRAAQHRECVRLFCALVPPR
jgi:hypothetical protein